MTWLPIVLVMAIVALFVGYALAKLSLREWEE